MAKGGDPKGGGCGERKGTSDRRRVGSGWLGGRELFAGHFPHKHLQENLGRGKRPRGGGREVRREKRAESSGRGEEIALYGKGKANFGRLDLEGVLHL